MMNRLWHFRKVGKPSRMAKRKHEQVQECRVQRRKSLISFSDAMCTPYTPPEVEDRNLVIALKQNVLQM